MLTAGPTLRRSSRSSSSSTTAGPEAAPGDMTVRPVDVVPAAVVTEKSTNRADTLLDDPLELRAGALAVEQLGEPDDVGKGGPHRLGYRSVGDQLVAVPPHPTPFWRGGAPVDAEEAVGGVLEEQFARADRPADQTQLAADEPAHDGRVPPPVVRGELVEVRDQRRRGQHGLAQVATGVDDRLVVGAEAERSGSPDRRGSPVPGR